MRYLIVCHDTGAEMAPLITWLANDPKNEIMLATDRGRDDFSPPGARKIILRKPEFKLARESVPEYLASFMRRSEKAAWALKVIAESADTPDIILASSSGGLAFCLPELFPKSYMATYLEDLSPWPGIEAKSRRLMQIMQIIRFNAVYAFDEAARDAIPQLVRHAAGIAPLAIDTDFFRPEKKYKNGGSVVFCLRGESPGKYAQIINAALKLAQLEKGREVVIIAPNPVAARFVAKMLESAPSENALNLMRYPTRVERRDILRSASLAICPKFGLDALEAMSCGAPVILNVNNTFDNGLPKPPPANKADFLAELLKDKKILEKSAKMGRADAVENFDYRKLIPAHIELILKGYEQFIAKI